MVQTAESVVVELRARTDGFDRKIKDSSRQFDRSMNTIGGASGRAEAKVRRDMQRIEGEVRRSSGQIQSTLRALGASLGAYFSTRELGALVDSFTRLQNSLKVVGLEGEALADVQEELRQIGAQYGVELEALASVFNRATLAQNELGASTGQIIELNKIVAASLRVTGSSSVQARGALLQLSQALGQDVVRAEEFNSILEGALPIAQAAARGIDGFGGSVAKLRSAIVDGEVTSRQFFEGILKGGVETIKQAENATLTLGGAFTVLKNELTLYVGEASRSNGVTAALSDAIRSLAANLDRVIPAISAIIALIGARYTGLLLAATGATLAKAAADLRATQAATAHAAAQARLGPLMLSTSAAANAAAASTSRLALATGALATGARGMLALFGGPVPAAILATGAALIYLYQNSETAADRLDRLGTSADKAEAEAARMEATLRAAGVAIGEVEVAADDGSVAIDGIGDAAKRSERDLYDLEQQAIRTAIALVQTQLQQNSARRSELGRNRQRAESGLGRPGESGGAIGISGSLPKQRNALIKEIDAETVQLDREFKALNRQRNAIIEAVRNGIDLNAAPAPIPTAAPAKKDKKKKAKADTGPTQEEIDFRFEGESVQLEQAALRGLQRFALNANERADLELASINLAQKRANEEIQADADYSKQQKEILQAQVARIANLDRSAVEIERQEQLERERLDLLQQINEGELDNARFALDEARTSGQRKEAALRILDLQLQLERALLESVLASETASDADKERAALAIAALEQRRANETRSIEQDNLGPIGSFLDEIPAGAEEINEALENIAANGLADVVDGLTDAIVNFRSLKDVAFSVLQGITQQLVRLALQQIILKIVGQTAGEAAVAATGAQAATAATAWAPAAALASLATLGQNAGPAAVALGTTNALAFALAATSGAGGLRDGGEVVGPGGPRDDKVLRRLSRKEFVINAESSRKIGLANLNFMNRTGEIPGFRNGGSIGLSAPGNTQAASGRGGGTSIDDQSLNRLAAVVARAAEAMPPVQLFPTLDPGKAFEAGLNNPGGRSALFDFLRANRSRVQGVLSQ